jgi:hypothetical protein
LQGEKTIKITCVTTTINLPAVLFEYEKNFKEKSNSEVPNFMVIGDNKTSYWAEQVCKGFTDINVQYFSPLRQKVWLDENFPKEDVSLVIPENDIRRRNIGFLVALKDGADYIVSLDDDNYPLVNDDWLETLKRAIEPKKAYLEVSSKNGYINPCNIMVYGENQYVYSRGYPIDKWYSDSFNSWITLGQTNTVMHQMLWTNKPDVDAVSNLVYPELKFEKFLEPEDFVGPVEPVLVANKDQFFPVDTQSIIFSKKLSVFHALYQESLFGMPCHRYDDIWAGLFCQKLIHKNGDHASFGAPLVEHRRNVHNFQKDLQMELVGMSVNCKMWEHINGLNIQSKNYKDGFVEIADSLHECFKEYDSYIQRYMCKLGESMRLWVKMLDKL